MQGSCFKIQNTTTTYSIIIKLDSSLQLRLVPFPHLPKTSILKVKKRGTTRTKARKLKKKMGPHTKTSKTHHHIIIGHKEVLLQWCLKVLPINTIQDRRWRASKVRWGMEAVHGFMGMGRWWVGPIWWWDWASDEEEGGTATRSHEGHIVRVVGGVICM